MGLRKWNFIHHPDNQALSLLDVNYWKSILDKTLKVGVELEFNLPKPGGQCQGDNAGCGCVHMAHDNCWKECVHKSFCETNKVIDRCVNRAENCGEEDCSVCEFFKHECFSILCSNFMSKCHICSSFKINCSDCELKYNPDKDPEGIRQLMKREFTPNNCYGVINKSGVHSVKQDGSLLGDKGAEIITIGRRVNYWEFYNMFDNIIGLATKNGAYMNERCSIHMHVLSSYYDKTVESKNNSKSHMPNYISELEKPLPEIVMINLHQLIRKYQNALTWMGMALPEPQRRTRWEKFRVSVLDISPVMRGMRRVKDDVFSISDGRKYGFVNYQFLKFSEDGRDLRTFHIEFRHLDGILSPTALSAFSCLWHAMVLKAVEISRYGVLEMESSSWLKKAKNMKESIMNNKGDWGGQRFSDTSNISKYEDDLREEALDLIRQVKHILIQKGPSYDVLENIAMNPFSYRIEAGDSWEDIERQLRVEKIEEDKDSFAKFVDEIIDLRGATGEANVNSWIKNVASMVIEEGVCEKAPESIENDVELYINMKQDMGELLWSTSLGTFVAI